jgi:hypothetical protein
MRAPILSGPCQWRGAAIAGSTANWREKGQYRRSPQVNGGRKLLRLWASKTGNFFLFSGTYCGYAE